MAGLVRGITYYTAAEANIKVFFPEDKTVCQYCRYVRNEDSLKRWKCLLTDEYLVYPFNGVGNNCPLKITERTENNNGDPCIGNGRIRQRKIREPEEL